ncbi:DUF2207 domain-containing protein [Kribbella speibonae]|uniref:DUF2207 domain-containing protein n=1 Tax=Kribbella speibonae TaxID=1572660 RepID=A0A4R0IC43_9ACTN|nr:DUF2207 domain-containing protein [Kribbella speibonae]TCC27915.1 DUF2207 domain-containing protein [Kribbella speibonae]TCC29474.1 DUF2207 domain-containing protein [Kribbella speibonae]
MSPKRRLLPAALLMSLTAPLFVALSTMAAEAVAPMATDQITAYSADATLTKDGELQVKETVDLTAGGTTFSRTLATRVRSDAERDRTYELKDVSATVNGQPAQGFQNDSTDDGRKLTLNVSGQSKIVYSYTVDNVVADSTEGRQVSWPIVQGFSTSIPKASLTVGVPFATWVTCFAGRTGSSLPCTSSQLAESAALQIEQNGVPAGGRVTFLTGLSDQATVQANAQFSTRWTLGRAFTVDKTTVGLAVLVFGLGLLGAVGLWFFRGRDAAKVGDGAPERPVLDGSDGPQFAAPDGIRPGQVGTVVDETADVVDITATLLDLAVRNYLTIVEQPRESQFGRLDWELQRLHPGGPELLAYEKALLDAVFADGDSVLVSALGPSLRPRLNLVREQLYSDVVTQGWFNNRPDAVRNRWITAGVVLLGAGVVLTIVLAIVSKFALVGFAVMAAGLVLALVGQAAPARTARGAAVLGRVAGLQHYLANETSADLPESHRLEFASRCLPYAAVLGLTEKWALEIAATDDDDDPDAGIGWYSGPENWHLSDIGESLSNFVTSFGGTLTTARRLFG